MIAIDATASAPVNTAVSPTSLTMTIAPGAMVLVFMGDNPNGTVSSVTVGADTATHVAGAGDQATTTGQLYVVNAATGGSNITVAANWATFARVFLFAMSFTGADPATLTASENTSGTSVTAPTTGNAGAWSVGMIDATGTATAPTGANQTSDAAAGAGTGASRNAFGVQHAAADRAVLSWTAPTLAYVIGASFAPLAAATLEEVAFLPRATLGRGVRHRGQISLFRQRAVELSGPPYAPVTITVIRVPSSSVAPSRSEVPGGNPQPALPVVMPRDTLLRGVRNREQITLFRERVPVVNVAQVAPAPGIWLPPTTFPASRNRTFFSVRGHRVTPVQPQIPVPPTVPGNRQPVGRRLAALASAHRRATVPSADPAAGKPRPRTAPAPMSRPRRRLQTVGQDTPPPAARPKPRIALALSRGRRNETRPSQETPLSRRRSSTRPLATVTRSQHASAAWAGQSIAPIAPRNRARAASPTRGRQRATVPTATVTLTPTWIPPRLGAPRRLLAAPARGRQITPTRPQIPVPRTIPGNRWSTARSKLAARRPARQTVTPAGQDTPPKTASAPRAKPVQRPGRRTTVTHAQTVAPPAGGRRRQPAAPQSRAKRAGAPAGQDTLAPRVSPRRQPPPVPSRARRASTPAGQPHTPTIARARVRTIMAPRRVQRFTPLFPPIIIVPPPPSICYPTVASIVTYASSAAIRGYTATATIGAYTPTAAIRGYSSGASLRPYTSTAAVRSYTSHAALSSYTSTAGLVKYTTGAIISTCGLGP